MKDQEVALIELVTRVLIGPRVAGGITSEVRRLESLVEVLEVFEAPESEWNRVARHVLKSSEGLDCRHYGHGSLMAKLAPYVSESIGAEFIEHALNIGNLQLLQEIVRGKFHRVPTTEEVLRIAEVLSKKGYVRSHDPVWSDLAGCVSKEAEAEINKFRRKVERCEEDEYIPL